MDEYRREVMEAIRNSDNSVIIGETGSGKTTRIPVYLLDDFPNAKIAVTQPRRVAARSVSRYVAEQRGGRIGDEVGFQVRFEDATTQGTRANFMTDGILLKKLQNDPLLEEFDIVMVDEAHERSLNIDFVLGLLKRAQAEREKQGKNQLKVIVTSATIEKDKFANYFGEAPVVEVPGRMFPVDVHYEPEQVRDYPKAAAERARQIAQSNQPGDVLIFMPGEEEIRRTIAEIEKLGVGGVDVMPLFGSMAPEDQDRIFAKSSKRKIIVATNIAETSLTIDGVTFVIDSGLIKQKDFNPTNGIEELNTKGHAKSGCEQRKGRAGRTAPGTCYRLYTEQDFTQRQQFQTPEIARSNLDHVILSMKTSGIEDVRGFDFIDRPKEEAIAQAIETLKMLGALDDKERLTKTGETMAELPLRPELARMLIEADKYGCAGSITTIAAMSGEKSIFVRPKEKSYEADAAHAAFKKGGSDFLTLLEVWKQWSAAGFNDRWARDRFLNVRQLFEVREVRGQLMRALRQNGIVAEDRGATDDNIQKSVAAGLIQHLIARAGRFSYQRVAGKMRDEIMIHPSSAAFSMKPELMIGSEVVTTTKTYARKCQPIDPNWFPDIAPQLLEEKSSETAYDQGSGVVMETVSYGLKGRYGEVARRRREVKDESRVRERFLIALYEGRVDIPCVRNNAIVISKLKDLADRSGGLVSVPDLKKFYEEKSGGAKNRDEAERMNDLMQLDFGEYCPPELMAEIDRKYPESIEVRGQRLEVSYEYRAGDPNSHYSDERAERFTATIAIPGDILFKIDDGDIPALGENGRPVVSYNHVESYGAIKTSSLEKLKSAVDAKRLENAWYNFRQPAARKVKPVALEPLPSLESLGLRPIPYDKDYQGNQILAYPGYRAEQTYDYDTHNYVYAYQTEYFRNESSARESTDRAIDYKSQSDAKEKRRMERDVLLVPAKARYEGLKRKMNEVLDGRPSAYGLSSDEFNKLGDAWRTAGYALISSDADPKKALEIMDDIERTLAESGTERERRLALVDEVRAELDAAAGKVGNIDRRSYPRYGLTADQYYDLSNKWREANEALGGGRYMPDPERARALLREIEAMIPVETEFTPEQEHLLDMLTGRDARHAKLVRVRGGTISEYASAFSPNDVMPNPTEIPIGGSGRALIVSGSRLTLVYGGGSAGSTFDLTDGDYVIGRDAGMVIRVETNPGAPYGLLAREIVNQSAGGQIEVPRPPARRRYEEPAPFSPPAPEPAKSGLGSLGDALKSVFGVKPAEKPKPPEKPAAMPAEKPKSAEREKVTAELRAELTGILRNARIFIDAVRAVPEPIDKKLTNAEKISKTRVRAAEARKDLNSTESELATSDDAPLVRGHVGDIARRAERLSEEMAKLRGEREDWTGRFKEFTARMSEISVAQDVEIDEALDAVIRPKIIALSKRKGEIEDLDGELETILIESL